MDEPKHEVPSEMVKAQNSALRKVAQAAWGVAHNPLDEYEASVLMDILSSAANSSWVTADFPAFAGGLKEAAQKAHWKYEHRDDGEFEYEPDDVRMGADHEPSTGPL